MFDIHKVITNEKHLVSFHDKKIHIKKFEFHINKVNKACIVTKINEPTICSFEGIH
jgi:hypothetical protein